MADTPGPRQNTVFTYGLGLVCGLPLASWVSAPITRGMGEATAMATVMALTLGFGAAGAALGYAIDRLRDSKGNKDGQED
ncbi:MAG: hypothetical protein AAF829_09960 [Pseudomonadota bacterium]